MRVNEKRPAQPIPKTNYPHNRVMQRRNGVLIECGSVIPVDEGDDWQTFANLCDNIPAEEIAFANFETYDPFEINWYLREYVGCHKPGPRGFNYMFDGAKPGLIFLPFPERLLDDVVARSLRDEERRRKKTILERRWDRRNIDIPEGEAMVKRTREAVYRAVQNHVPNEQDFDAQREFIDFFTGLGVDAGESILKGKRPSLPGMHDVLLKSLAKPLKELHPENDRVRALRKSFYDAYASGFAQGLFPEYKVPAHKMTSGQRKYLEKGRRDAKQLSTLERYQFLMGLLDRARRWGIRGTNPVYQQLRNFQDGMSGRAVEYYLQREFSSSRLLERNIHETPVHKDVVDSAKKTIEQKLQDNFPI